MTSRLNWSGGSRNRHEATVNAIANRLSLRQPLRDSLAIPARVCEIAPVEKGAAPATALAIIRSEFPTVTDFERDFPSLCFALATGVTKTLRNRHPPNRFYRGSGGKPSQRECPSGQYRS
jgi:hypothetical protein